jgi:ATP-binding cassette, subfamily B, multidrug efflux pump
VNTIKRFISLIRPYRWKVGLSAVLLFVLTGIDLVFPSIIQRVIDEGLAGGQTNFMVLAAFILLALGVLKSVLTYVQRYQSESIANGVAYDLRNRLYDHIQRLSFSFHDHTQSGQLISRCIEDVRSIQGFMGNGIVELIHVSLLLVAILIILIAASPTLALISLLPMIPLVMVTSGFGRRIGKMFLLVDNILGELSSKLQENVTGVQVVRAFAREQHEIGRFEASNRDLFKGQYAVLQEWAKVMPTTTLLVTLSTILILWFGGQMVLEGKLTLGELVAFNSYMLLLAMPSQQIGWLVNAGGEAFAGTQRAFEILELAPEIRSTPQAVTLPPLKGEVEFDHVSFRYFGEKNLALEDINLKAQPNQVIALIGLTGSGKTSLINLIPRFYDVSKGAVRVDGIDVRSVELKSLRQQIGIVLQTSLLFSATLRENLAFGHPDATDEQIETAIKAAQAYDFIQHLPKGLDTVVGERGVTLSGGQRQRVAIARALLMDPRILILDDSTSSVDSQTEHLIQQALDHLMEGRTTFVIAQRLSTIRRADLVLVLDQGRIVQRGTNQELLAQEGLYRHIYDLQLRDQEEFMATMGELEEGAPVEPSTAASHPVDTGLINQ